ncbi:helix-turn-helix domain-containing protein [Flagellatimonas centrodinii]|uniref:helix-turn-helix transcriptional regulator n=1 Tax=Flagellatimonas centrodinii TaxID=2806210 RepID=UPI001FEFB7B7|nr:helix-turn-helix transcriptional regulator [Flagellatimonas centrodinii]ULQ45853.1 helix-turn-helix domain-containing protein [Flagellatimonas centrodinii]
MDIGRAELIRNARLNRGMGAAELARRMGVSRQTIHSWETSDSVEIKASNMRRLAQILNLTFFESGGTGDDSDASEVNEKKAAFNLDSRPVGVHMLETAIQVFTSRMEMVSNELRETDRLTHQSACETADRIASKLKEHTNELDRYIDVAKRAFQLELNR